MDPGTDPKSVQAAQWAAKEKEVGQSRESTEERMSFTNLSFPTPARRSQSKTIPEEHLDRDQAESPSGFDLQSCGACTGIHAMPDEIAKHAAGAQSGLDERERPKSFWEKKKRQFFSSTSLPDRPYDPAELQNHNSQIEYA